MYKTWLLMKTILKMQYSKAGKKNSHQWLYVIAAFFCLPLVFVYISFVRNAVTAMHDLLQPAGQESLILGLLFLSIHLLLFFVSIFTVVSAFYFAEDIEAFIPFPFHSYQLLLGKATVPFIYLYLTAGAVFLPAFYFYGTVSGASVFYYSFGLILFFLLPIIPFSISSILIMIVMRFVNIAKNKDRSKVAAGILSLAFIIFINVLVRLNTNTDEVFYDFAAFIQESDGLLRLLTSFYPPAYMSTIALIEPVSWLGFFFFISVIAVHIGVFFLFLWGGQLFYLKGVLGISTGRKRRVSQKKLNKQITTRPIWLSYMQKELRIILRTPTFFMQCVIQSFFGPVFLVIILLLDFGNNSLSGVMDVFSDKQSILVLFIITVFMLGVNATATTSISREGKSWQANLFLPLDIRQVFFSKIATAWVVNLFMILLAFLILTLFLKITGVTVFLWLILVLTANWFISTLGTYLDFLEPKLNWTDEQEVFKKLTGLFSLLFSVGILGFIVLILWNIDTLQGLFSSTFILFTCMLISQLLLQKLFKKKISTNEQQQL
ncbi:putative ABC transporter permease subunit [Virgibacillus ainsalahensis]